jgi:uncharacterized membrane protein
MPEGAAFCPGCGLATQQVERVRGKVGPLPLAVAGALAYFTIFPAIFFLLVEPYSKNRFVRFHAVQCLALSVAGIALCAALRIASLLLFFIPALGHLLVLLVSMVAGLGFFILWLVLIVKAAQGEMFKLPLLGHFVERQSAPR